MPEFVGGREDLRHPRLHPHVTDVELDRHQHALLQAAQQAHRHVHLHLQVGQVGVLDQRLARLNGVAHLHQLAHDDAVERREGTRVAQLGVDLFDP